MSTLETNAIGKYSGDNVSVDDALNLKSYSTSARDALTSVAGDTIYNSDDNKVQVYTGSAWENLGGAEAVNMQLLIIGGGGGMTNVAQGGGGAGAGEFIDEEIFLSPSTNYTVTVGGGGSTGGTNGNPTSVGELSSAGGGYGGRGLNFIDDSTLALRGGSGASGGGGASTNRNISTSPSGYGSAKNGNNGGTGRSNSSNANDRVGGGGGGAGAAGTSATSQAAGNGGNGLTTTIITTTQAGTYSVGEVSGSDLYFAGGGGGGGKITNGSGGLGGGGNEGQNGTANTGGGAGGSFSDTTNPPDYAGGSGVVIIKYDENYAVSVGAGLTSSTVSDPPTGYKIEIFTAGTGTVSFA